MPVGGPFARVQLGIAQLNIVGSGACDVTDLPAAGMMQTAP